MSGWRGPGDPAPEATAEGAFRKNLRETVSGWRQRLAQPGAAVAIGTEAAELRRLAQSRGWGAVALQLQGVEQLARAAPGALAPAVVALERFLNPAAAPLAAGVPGVPGFPDMTVRISPRIVDAPAPLPNLPDSMPRSLPRSIPMPPMLDAPGPPNANPGAAAAPPLAEFGATLASERGALPTIPRPQGASPSPERRVEPLPDSIGKPAPQPKLLVKTVLGFRAFGKKAARSSEPSGPEPLDRDSPLLGLGRRSSKPPQRGSSPPVDGPPNFLARRGSPIPFRPSSPSDPWDGARRQRPSGSGRPPHMPRGGVPRWVYVLGGAVATLAVATVIVVIVSMRIPALTQVVTARDAAAPLIASGEPTDPPASTSDSMIDAVHDQGHETAELRALIDQQSRMLAACRLDATKCDKWAREALLLAPIDAGTFVPSPENGQPLSAWLQRLKVPRDFPAKDDPALAAFYGYDAKHPTGRADFQVKLFRCSKFEDVFDTTLVKYGAPPWLKAVVYQESGCDPVITSPTGARGLWQFMPESARAYGLLVNEKGDVDERLNPTKATDAAIHFLMDLHAKLGAWDLALAGYNMGPYGVSLRIAQVGGHAGFWDLRRSDLLPTETADYVPAIEAFALILENRRSLGFPIDVPLPESTSELNVKPGTRLSLVARVARTSTTRIKEHNLDFLGQVVPVGETTVRVPISSDQVLQVQQALDNWPPDDSRDTCAPPDYVWGSGDFETTAYAKKCHASPDP